MARVLILGGVGFIGRNLVQYLVANKLASKICVADKVLPEVAGLADSELAVFKSDVVTFKQCNLARDGSLSCRSSARSYRFMKRCNSLAVYLFEAIVQVY